ncbi:type IV secretion protein Rhs, partial [Providencia rettgeri]|nr:type IV secretion protein Rhs [Providencia rettgeri]
MNKFFSQSQNFISALKTGIDPRTGIFSLNIPIVNINCNYGMGPEINLSLCSSSLQNNNSGFGMGFSLPLTTYDSKNKLLHLSSGEKYLINDTVANFEVKQKKLNNFIFERFDDFYKITYKSGVVEILEGPSSGSDIKNTLKIESYDGHFVILKWAFFGFPHLLEIKDENNVLLS